MAKIKQISAREVLNGKGIPTIETTVVLQNGMSAVASVPSGISLGTYEAVEIRDKDPQRFHGMGVLKAVNTVNSLIGPKLVGMEVTKQQEIDKAMIDMDGTQNKSRLGSNAMLSVSIAVVKAGAYSSIMPVFLYLRQFLNNKNTPLSIPTPLFNMIEGGKHAMGTIDFQEIFVVPATSKTYSENLQIGFGIYNSLQDMLRVNGFSTLIGDVGGFSPQVKSDFDAISLLSQAIDTTNYRLGFDVFIGIDGSANTFYSNQRYKIRDKQSNLSSNDLLSYYVELSKQFHILYLEDILAEDDWAGWQKAISMLGTQTLVVGDDLTSTNPYRLQMALEKKALTALVIKPTQIGTVIEALAVTEVARAGGLKIIVANRGQETTDSFIADFAVGVGAEYCKFGALARGERVIKYNRLLQIEQQLHALK
ncbi:MAG TPA: phosphopyruvate hydratase [Patescibacteria group bacterium]